MLTKFFDYKADWLEVLLAETAAVSFVLILAKTWSPLLSLDWYWYLIIGIVAAFKPVKNCFSS